MVNYHKLGSHFALSRIAKIEKGTEYMFENYHTIYSYKYRTDAKLHHPKLFTKFHYKYDGNLNFLSYRKIIEI